MDPVRRGRKRQRHRRPRPRGDGPSRCAPPRRGPRSPPPTRGWTSQKRIPGNASKVAPAHAGMDRRHRGFRRRTRCRPRPRGDGPNPLPLCARPLRSPPPTRGWTLEPQRGRLHRLVAPAHAGMDLQSWDIPPVLMCRPRPRGDGPHPVVHACMRVMSPPPTRGWTSPLGSAWSAPPVAPAHAGMDPTPTTAARRRGGRPRPRGDGPVGGDNAKGWGGSPPPTRGWTAVAGVRGPQDPVAPAHAGMDPRGRHYRGRTLRRPRPRGDGPVTTAT